MTTKHWDDDELIRHIYGVGPEDRHLEECGECAGRWQALLAERQGVLEPPSFSEELLAAQRRAIRGRLGTYGTRPGWFPLATAALATAAVIVLAMMLQRPGPTSAPQLSDAELYAEAYSLAMGTEPAALEPMHALFEEVAR